MPTGRVRLTSSPNLTGKNAEAVHELISGASIDAGRKLTFSELLAYVKEVLGLL
jgi:hypothetical protein